MPTTVPDPVPPVDEHRSSPPECQLIFTTGDRDTRVWPGLRQGDPCPLGTRCPTPNPQQLARSAPPPPFCVRVALRPDGLPASSLVLVPVPLGGCRPVAALPSASFPLRCRGNAARQVFQDIGDSQGRARSSATEPTPGRTGAPVLDAGRLTRSGSASPQPGGLPHGGDQRRHDESPEGPPTRGSRCGRGPR